MQKRFPKNILSLIVAAACATPLAALVARSSPNAVIAMLTTIVTVLLLEVAFLRRDLSTLKEQTLENEKNEL